MASLEDIRFHYAIMQDALLIFQSGVGDTIQAREEYHEAKGWLARNDAVGKLLEYIDQMEDKNDHE